MRIAVYASNHKDTIIIKSGIDEFKAYKHQHPILSSFHSIWDLVIHDHPLDAIFIQVDKDNKRPIEIAQKYKHRHRHTQIIFFSDHPFFMKESYEIKVLDFLVKPFSRSKILRLLNEIYLDWHYLNQHSIIVRIDEYSQRLPYRHIVYIESLKHQIIYHLYNGKTITAWGSLSDLEQSLSSDNRFIKCHRSYIINVEYFTKIGEGTLTLMNTIEIPISRKRYGEIKNMIIISSSL